MRRQAKAGVDITYSVTPSLRAAVTVNTDFAEVEIDERRVNLTRFPLRFPEQRDFFLEGSGVFTFPWAEPFFSRRIGLVEGQEVPIAYGARLGGQAGRYEIGYYQVRTGRTSLEGPDGAEQPWPQEDFTAGRVKRTLFQQSHVGTIYTRRSSARDSDGIGVPDRHTIGADLELYSSQTLGRYNSRFSAYMVYHTDPVEGGDLFSPERRARGYRIHFPNDLVGLRYAWRDFGDSWDPAMGFSQRNGFSRHLFIFELFPRPQRWARIRQTTHEFRWEYMTDLDSQKLYQIIELNLLGVNFESGDRLALHGGREFERLRRPFVIHGSGEDALLIQPGDYHAWIGTVGFQSAERRTLSGSADLVWSDFWGGDRTQVDLSATARPRRGVSVSTSYARNDVRLPHGDFATNLVRVSWAWNLSPLTSVIGSVQYDDVTNVAGLFLRARWIVRPGSDVFLVWTHNWHNDAHRLLDPDFTTLSRGGAVKMNYSYRF